MHYLDGVKKIGELIQVFAQVKGDDRETVREEIEEQIKKLDELDKQGIPPEVEESLLKIIQAYREAATASPGDQLVILYEVIEPEFEGILTRLKAADQGSETES